ncbi:MAG: NAD(P)/FAD-dependent oxidoreductase [Tannerellaceae bacterium]|jgi:uncharacterized FAD-dependent dehydrogenase|nr:NAD(P)/FAD-dependent oxidoreductase [Tannerellaceae bacterium]
MIKELQLRVLPEEAADESLLKATVARQTGIDPLHIRAVRILKHSIDARQRTVYVNLSLRIFINEDPEPPEYLTLEYPDVSSRPSVVVVGAGPAGLFAALRLIELGLRPIVIERGKNVRERKKDIARISREGTVDPDSNYCFGEGGAGAFSDGKLYTRSRKRGSTDKILNALCRHGASPSILYDARPHIGTDKLSRVIENIRATILESGGEVHFQTHVNYFRIKDNRLLGVGTASGMFFEAPVLLATGHAARDVYETLRQQKVAVEAKAIAVGLRMEHPQELIDKIQYHLADRSRGVLPAAEYRFVAQAGNRGVYSFCMCPGGFVVPAASGPRQVVVNGMSASQRNSPWANAGVVVELHPEDLPMFASHGELAVMKFQEWLEDLAWKQGGMSQAAPAQRLNEFLRRRASQRLPRSSYTPGLVASPIHEWMPEFITAKLTEGLKRFGRTAPGLLTDEAVVIGVETRTSAPVRIPRNPETCRHTVIEGLFPCGEGAGYAGGIMSAAMDGERCAEAVAVYLSGR